MVLPLEVETWLQKPLLVQTQQRIVEILKASPEYNHVSIQDIEDVTRPVNQGLVTFALMHGVDISENMMAAIMFAPSFGHVELSSTRLPLEIHNRVTILAEIISMAHTYTDDSLKSFKEEWDKARPMVPDSLIYEDREGFITAIKALAMHYYSIGNMSISHGNPDEIPYQHAMGGYLMHVGRDIFGQDMFDRNTQLDLSIEAAKTLLNTHHAEQNPDNARRPGDDDGR